MIEIRPVPTDDILDAAIEEAHKWEATLAPSGKKGKAEKALSALKEGQLKFSNPEPYVKALNVDRFTEHGLNLAPDILAGIRDGKGYTHYLIPAPVLLFPGRGAQYRLLEGSLTINIASHDPKSGIVRTFPEPAWKPVLAWGSRFNLAVDSNLTWGAEVEQIDVKLNKLNADLAGRVKNKNDLKGFITVFPFEHTLGRMEIEAPFTTDTAAWRLDSKNVIRSERNIWLVMIVKVPNGVTELKISAAAQAEVAIDWLTAQIEHVFDRFSHVFQDLIGNKRRGPPLQHFEEWTVKLPRV